MAYRTATHESTGLTPAKTMMGRELRVPLDLLIGTTPESNQTSKISYVEKLKESLNIAHIHGPYIIVKRINDLVHRIQLPDRCKPMVVHRNRLRWGKYGTDIINSRWQEQV